MAQIGSQLNPGAGPGTPPPLNPFATDRSPAQAWYIHLDDQQQGPFGLDVLGEGVRSGRFTVETPVWSKGMQAWAAAGSVAALAALFEDGEGPPPFPGKSDQL
jgi:hypothetical protein